MVGKQIRLERIMNRDTGRTVIVPMDHGVTVGPIDGLIDMKTTVNAVASGGANAIVIHKGLVTSGHRRRGKDVGLIIHLSGSTALSPYPNAKTLVCTVEEAIKLGADAVSIHVNVGNGTEREMLSDLGRVAREAREWGMPLLAMMYPRGEKIKDEYDPQVIMHVARSGGGTGGGYRQGLLHRFGGVVPPGGGRLPGAGGHCRRPQDEFRPGHPGDGERGHRGRGRRGVHRPQCLPAP